MTIKKEEIPWIVFGIIMFLVLSRYLYLMWITNGASLLAQPPQ